MFWSKKKKKATQDLWKAIAEGSLSEVRLAVETGAKLSQKNPDGHGVLRLAIRMENLPVLDYLLRSGARPDGECAGAMALWVERADRARRHGKKGASAALLRARMALKLLEQYHAPWDEGIPGLGSGDSARIAINHILPGCLDARSV